MITLPSGATIETSGDWVRDHAHDKRIGRGDDYAGDAWINRVTGEQKWTAVGQKPMPKIEGPNLRACHGTFWTE